MDQSQALHKLLESADLIGMLQDLISPERLEELSPASWAGMRITLNTMREHILEGHAELSRGLVKSARSEKEVISPITTRKRESGRRLTDTPKETEIAVASTANEQTKDLKSALERFVER